MVTSTCKFLLALSALAALILTAPQAYAQLASSTFDSNSEGWAVADLDQSNNLVGTYTVTWNANGGNPGGYVSSTDPTSNNFTFSAPAAFLGNKALAYGGSLQYDLFDMESDGVPYQAVILKGAGQTLFYTTDQPAMTFTRYTIPLMPTGWNLNGATPSAAQMQATLSGLDALYILGDWRTGTDLSGLDNVKLFAGTNPVPEPGVVAVITSIWIFGGSLLLRRRQK